MSDPNDSHIVEAERQLRSSRWPASPIKLWSMGTGALLIFAALFAWDHIKPFIEKQMLEFTNRPGGYVTAAAMALILYGLSFVADKVIMNTGTLVKLLKGQRKLEMQMTELEKTLETLAGLATSSSESGELRTDYMRQLLEIEQAREKASFYTGKTPGTRGAGTGVVEEGQRKEPGTD